MTRSMTLAFLLTLVLGSAHSPARVTAAGPLTPALLNQSDLPEADWHVYADVPLNEALLFQVCNRAPAEPLQVEAMERVKFVDEASQSFVVQTMVRFRNGGAARWLSFLRDLGPSCTVAVQTSDGQPGRGRWELRETGTMADEVLRVHASFEAFPIRASSDIIYVRHGDMLTWIETGRYDADATEPDTALTEQLARRAYERLLAVLPLAE